MKLLLSALCAAGLGVVCDALLAASVARKYPYPPKACPGKPLCNNHGDCDYKTGICWCESGFDGAGCEDESPLYVEVTNVKAPELQDMLGRYKADGMYLKEVTDPNTGLGVHPALPDIKFIHYDHLSSGWAVSSFNSSCIDDTCFFAYAPQAAKIPVPPSSGYVYGGPILHVYYAQMMYDDADMDPRYGGKRGYHMTLAFTPDPKVQGSTYLTAYNGRYVLQPRFTHVTNKKYAIMPVSLHGPGKMWVATGLMGNNPRKRKIIASAEDVSESRYMPPREFWAPKELEFELKAACDNHIGDDACIYLEPQCLMDDSDGLWARQCCRNTCGSCLISRSACVLPKANSIITAMLRAKRSKIMMPALPNATGLK